MSWFKRRPRIKSQEKKMPYQNSPSSERQLKEAKKRTQPENNTDNKTSI